MLQSPAFGLWLLSCLLTPCARGSPDSDWLQWGGEGSSSKPMALRDQGSATLPHAHTALAWGPSPPPHTCVHWFRSIPGSCCVARYRGHLVGEKNGCLNKSNRQSTTSPVLDPCYCSASKQHVTLTKLAHCLFQRQPTDQPDKIALQP